MKKIIYFALGVLLCAVCYTVIGQKTDVHPKKEKKELRQQKRADRIAAYKQMVDSIVLTRNFRFNPTSMQRQPAGRTRQIYNPAFEMSMWDGYADISLPYVKGYTPPYYVAILNYTLPSVEHYIAEQTNEGWVISFTSSMFTAGTYTFTFEIFSRTGGATLTIKNPWYNDVQYQGTISRIY